jgi:hypothetical protein
VSRPYLPTLGAEASSRWLAALELEPETHWYAKIVLLGTGESRFELAIFAEEWGFQFARGSRASWIRVTDVPFAHGRDDFGLLAELPDVLEVNALISRLEQQHGIELDRSAATIHTNLAGAGSVIRAWVSPRHRTVEPWDDATKRESRIDPWGDDATKRK